MKKENMLDYLDKMIAKYLGEYDCAIDWDKKNHTIELIVTLYAQNAKDIQIEDVEGVLSDEVIEFEDGVLFYHPEKSNFDPEDYLHTIPYEGKKGLPNTQLEAVGAYLQTVLANGESDLLDFLHDEEEEVFELQWLQTAFKLEVKRQEQQMEQQMIAYPSY